MNHFWGKRPDFTLKTFLVHIGKLERTQGYARVSTCSCIFSLPGWAHMSWGWNNGSNKWIKGKFTDIETSPHSQPEACIKILRQHTAWRRFCCIWESNITAARLLWEHVEKPINHQPAVTVLRVTNDEKEPQTLRLCVYPPAYVQSEPSPSLWMTWWGSVGPCTWPDAAAAGARSGGHLEADGPDSVNICVGLPPL